MMLFLVVVILMSVIQCIFAALQNQKIEGYIVVGSKFVELLKKLLGKSYSSWNVGTFKFFINFKHVYFLFFYMLYLYYLLIIIIKYVTITII